MIKYFIKLVCVMSFLMLGNTVLVQAVEHTSNGQTSFYGSYTDETNAPEKEIPNNKKETIGNSNVSEKESDVVIDEVDVIPNFGNKPHTIIRNFGMILLAVMSGLIIYRKGGDLV